MVVYLPPRKVRRPDTESPHFCILRHTDWTLAISTRRDRGRVASFVQRGGGHCSLLAQASTVHSQCIRPVAGIGGANRSFKEPDSDLARREAGTNCLPASRHYTRDDGWNLE